jgi:oligopeptide/dipeptide ABC transporter ATP-binding protein
MSGAPAMQVTQLNVAYGSGGSLIRAVNDVDLEVRAGESLGIVGESGSGKTQLLLAMLGLSPVTAQLSGSVRYHGEELLGAPRRNLNRIRGARIGLVFQDPMTALNPFLTIGTQLIEGLRAHRRVTAAAARRRALELLELVQIAAPELRLRQFPHQLSGGMRQRVLIAMALICEPEILLCDEPTTALDVTVQAQIIALLQELRARTGVTLVLVTHDLGVIAQLAERVAVMYAGRVVEQASVDALLTAPRHPYSEGLLRSTLSLTIPVATRLTAMDGNPPDLRSLPAGCAFAPRCPYVLEDCRSQVPALQALGTDHRRACFYDGPLGRHPGVIT